MLRSLSLAGIGVGNGGSRVGQAVVSQKQTGRWTPGTPWAAATGSAAPQARTLRPFPAHSPRRDSSLAGSLGRFLLALLRVPELDGVTVPRWALPPSRRFLCPAQVVSASFCGDHDEYSGRFLEDPVRKKNHL